ncbi:MAG TPA: LuxR C-terminal-related transcriptional regulator [Gemmatimonadaceae bacterium]|nr:LuxR C-terminal-related transcriptional regulator [Gemmatimonadaceae bacterium]
MSDMGIVNEADADTRLRLLLAVVLVATSIGSGLDIYFDAPDPWWSAHAISELVLTVLAMTMSIVFWRGWWRSRQTLAAVQRTVATHVAERDAWRRSAEMALASFARAVDERFAAWGLTPTEREIGLRLLKGHSHKQIAYETGRSERTVRQHAVAIYQKSGLTGRAELSAFFLEDLFLPEKRQATA